MNLNCRIRPIIVPEYNSSDRKEFCQERARAYVRRYAPDMEAITGLSTIFDSYRLSEEEQIRGLREIRRGNYPKNNYKNKL